MLTSSLDPVPLRGQHDFDIDPAPAAAPPTPLY